MVVVVGVKSLQERSFCLPAVFIDPLQTWNKRYGPAQTRQETQKFMCAVCWRGRGGGGGGAPGLDGPGSDLGRVGPDWIKRSSSQTNGGLDCKHGPELLVSLDGDFPANLQFNRSYQSGLFPVQGWIFLKQKKSL